MIVDDSTQIRLQLLRNRKLRRVVGHLQYLLAIQPCFIGAKRCYCQPRGTDTAAEREVLAQQGSVRYHAIRPGHSLRAIHAHAERCIERSNLLRWGPRAVISSAHAPCAASIGEVDSAL